MKLIVPPSVADFHRTGASFVLERLERDPSLVAALPTGSTSEGLYRELVPRLGRGADLSRSTVVALDEYVGLGPEDPRSFSLYLRTHLLSRVGVGRARLIDGAAPDPHQEASRHEEFIAAAGGLDLAVLGLGANGHIAFNEPGSPFDARTRVVHLSEETRRANSRFFGSMEKVPDRAITVGMGTLLEAREVLLLAAGEGKEHALQTTVHGPATRSVPASALLHHPRVTAVVTPRLARRAGLPAVA